ncbi:MAG: hypothetical protein NC206_01085 [Bacteroides sp.]|nr:hypothetical protein [Roseburia sp.]MCM1345665.1 hypothetical protein [Bacteroides sp.]MCM1419900.1 hypothetical protein [Bacteroides sp.]
MENQDFIDRSGDDLVDEEAGTDASCKKVFNKYRNIGKCVADGISFVTERFFHFMRLTLPASIPLAAFSAICVYMVFDMSFMLLESKMYALGFIGTGMVVVNVLLQSVIFRLVKLHSQNADLDAVTLTGMYKTIWSDFVKVLGYNILSSVILGLVTLVCILILSIPENGIELSFVKYALVAVWLLVAWVFYLPYNVSLPALVCGGKTFFPALWHGYMLGLRKIGKTMALSVLTSLLMGVLFLLLLSPAAIIAMVRHSASYSMVVGDPVTLPDNFAVFSILILFVASFLSTLLEWVNYVPMSYLYASFVYDAEEQKKSELPMV